jgi:hypothetical protein
VVSRHVVLWALLAACTWAPNPAEVQCDSDARCPPGWRCDLDAGRCEEDVGADDDDSSDDDDAVDDDDTIDDDDALPDDDDAVDDDDTLPDDDDAADDDDTSVVDDDDSDAAAAVLDQQYCLRWSSVTIAEDPLDLIAAQVLDHPLLVHFSAVSEGWLDLEAHAGDVGCSPSAAFLAEVFSYTFFDRDWTFTPGNGRFTAGPITRLQIATQAGLGLIFDPVMSATYDAANDQFVDGTLDGELWITPVLDTLPTITCDSAPGCHACPGLYNDEDCITLSLSGAIWDHAGSGTF